MIRTRHFLDHQTRTAQEWGIWVETVAKAMEGDVTMTVVTGGERCEEKTLRTPLERGRVAREMTKLGAGALESIRLDATGQEPASLTLEVHRRWKIGPIEGARATILAGTDATRQIMQAMDTPRSEGPPLPGSKPRRVAAVLLVWLAVASIATLTVGGIEGTTIGILLGASAIAVALTTQDDIERARHASGAGLALHAKDTAHPP